MADNPTWHLRDWIIKKLAEPQGKIFRAANATDFVLRFWQKLHKSCAFEKVVLKFMTQKPIVVLFNGPAEISGITKTNLIWTERTFLTD